MAGRANAFTGLSFGEQYDFTSRYQICQKTIEMNTKYAEKKNNNIVIILFNEGVTILTNMKISDESKERIKKNYTKRYVLYDNLSYDDIITKINKSRPNHSTDFLAPFQFLECVPEFTSTSPEIIFLSDGRNTTDLNTEELSFLTKFKNNVTTMGIGNKSCFDQTTLSKMSKTGDTVEGESADIIQNELLARMADSESSNALDIWKNATITFMTEKDNIKVGTLVQVEKITKDIYDAFTPVNTKEQNNLLMYTFDNTIVFKKKDDPINLDMSIKKDTIIFIVDQSGSMDEPANSNDNMYVSSPTQPVVQDEQVETDDEYIKYTIKYTVMKSYQLFLLNFIDPTKIKAELKYTDMKNVEQSIIIDCSIMTTDSDKFNMDASDLPNIQMMITIINDIGHCINIANIVNHSDKIGYFRKINNICNKNKKFITDMTMSPINNVSLMEMFHYTIKQGRKLYQTTLSAAQINIDNLLRAASDGSSRQMSAAVTMSAVCGRSPSQPVEHDETSTNNTNDISMCTICCGEIREYVFSCGHCYSCKDCAEKLLASAPMNKCSYCKQDVTSIRKITMTDDQRNSDHYYKCITPDCFNVATTIASCPPINEDDSGYHLTTCDKCYKISIKNYKKMKQTHTCFCGNEMKEFKKVIFS